MENYENWNIRPKSHTYLSEISSKGVCINADLADKLVKVASTARNLKGHGLDEGISTRLLTYAASLMDQGIEAQAACKMALVRPITDDADIRDTLDHAINTIFA